MMPTTSAASTPSRSAMRKAESTLSPVVNHLQLRFQSTPDRRPPSTGLIQSDLLGCRLGYPTPAHEDPSPTPIPVSRCPVALRSIRCPIAAHFADTFRC